MCKAQFLRRNNFFCPVVISAIITSANASIIKHMILILWYATHAMASELVFGVESFIIDSMIRGYHVYKDIWSSFIEVLHCRRDVWNHHSPFAIAHVVCKGTTVVGHVPRKYLQFVLFFSGEDTNNNNQHSYRFKVVLSWPPTKWHGDSMGKEVCWQQGDGE